MFFTVIFITYEQLHIVFVPDFAFSHKIGNLIESKEPYSVCWASFLFTNVIAFSFLNSALNYSTKPDFLLLFFFIPTH